MKRERRKFSSEFKAKVALEAIKERKTVQQLAVDYDLHPNQINDWKKAFLNRASEVFEGDSKLQDEKEQWEKEKKEMFERIGRLNMENEFLKKKVL